MDNRFLATPATMQLGLRGIDPFKMLGRAIKGNVFPKSSVFSLTSAPRATHSFSISGSTILNNPVVRQAFRSKHVSRILSSSVLAAFLPKLLIVGWADELIRQGILSLLTGLGVFEMACEYQELDDRMALIKVGADIVPHTDHYMASIQTVHSLDQSNIKAVVQYAGNDIVIINYTHGTYHQKVDEITVDSITHAKALNEVKFPQHGVKMDHTGSAKVVALFKIPESGMARLHGVHMHYTTSDNICLYSASLFSFTMGFFLYRIYYEIMRGLSSARNFKIDQRVVHPKVQYQRVDDADFRGDTPPQNRDAPESHLVNDDTGDSALAREIDLDDVDSGVGTLPQNKDVLEVLLDANDAGGETVAQYEDDSDVASDSDDDGGITLTQHDTLHNGYDSVSETLVTSSDSNDSSFPWHVSSCGVFEVKNSWKIYDPSLAYNSGVSENSGSEEDDNATSPSILSDGLEDEEYMIEDHQTDYDTYSNNMSNFKVPLPPRSRYVEDPRLISDSEYSTCEVHEEVDMLKLQAMDHSPQSLSVFTQDPVALASYQQPPTVEESVLRDIAIPPLAVLNASMAPHIYPDDLPAVDYFPKPRLMIGPKRRILAAVDSRVYVDKDDCFFEAIGDGTRMRVDIQDCIRVLKHSLPSLQTPEVTDDYFAWGPTRSGTFHIAQFITVLTGAWQGSYVIKIPKAGLSSTWTMEDSLMMQADSDVMDVVRLKTECPVPEVLGVDSCLGAENILGLPYMLMLEANGVPAHQLWSRFDSNGIIVPQDIQQAKQETFVKDLAIAMSQLQALRFHRTGSILVKEKTHVGMASTFTWCCTSNGEEKLQTEPTFNNEGDFWRFHLDEVCPWSASNNLEDDAEMQKNGKRILMTFIVESVIAVSRAHGSGRLPFTSNLQNILVNEETGQLLRIIDWDRARAAPAPIGCTALPLFLSRDYFGQLLERDTDEQHVKLSLAQIDQYRKLYAKTMVEATGPDGDGKYTLKSGVYQALYGALFGCALEWRNVDDFLSKMLLESEELRRHDPYEIFRRLGRGDSHVVGRLDVLRAMEKVVAPRLPKMSNALL